MARRERGGRTAVVAFVTLALLPLSLVACSSRGSEPVADAPPLPLAAEAPAVEADPLVPADSSSPDASARPGVPASSIAEDSRLEVILDGERIPLRNGGRINLEGDLAVEPFLDPYPPTIQRLWLDLYVTRGPEGSPVSDAEATIQYDMRFMYHGFTKAEAKNLGDGHYLFTLDYGMYGPWDQLLTLRIGEERHELALLIIASPEG